jgi:hypothetical protein
MFSRYGAFFYDKKSSHGVPIIDNFYFRVLRHESVINVRLSLTSGIIKARPRLLAQGSCLSVTYFFVTA